ncbi:GNAT family N-acetyltransferase [Heyndrickxia sp. NPDC080065]|uniref:GNAT family N-acetyltransferase n=1 Tax=Heyndrickxia sp. NPDC080065 TaxID=3390568 RepID=UPI003CFD2228
MKSMTETIKIVEYHEGLAKSIADMWNESRDSWGGDASIKTEEQVKEQEANSEDLYLYLALDGDKVVGYCGISEYKEDTHALYIRLLNVHPDYHGKKIGKLLVLKAVEKTVEQGFPRIDLYTWPGNVKAVPLYKKCGFFWEDRDDTTHLMNFIPMVLQNEITKPYFKHIDWYKDNIRAIEVKPDGIKENGFTYYEYVWRNADYYLRIHIERSGRGLRLIETNDFLAEVMLDQHTQIEGRESKLQLFVKNKGTNPMHLMLEGLKNERIVVSENKEVSIQNEEKLLLPVVIKDGEEPNEWVTHPRAEVKVKINGIPSIFAIGMYPKKAMKLKAVYKPKKYETNKDQYCYLEIENHLKTDAEITVEFSSNSLVEWDKLTHSIMVNDIGILKIPFHVKNYGFLQSECTVKVQTENETFQWKETLAFGIPNFGVKAGGYDKEFYYLQNGFYKVIVRKRDNAISFGSDQTLEQRTILLPPKFGKPYVGELTKKQASYFEYDESNSAATMKIHYEVNQPLSMKIVLCFELYGEGLLNYWMEIENTSENTFTDLFVYQPVRHEINKTFIPLKGEVIYFNDAKITDWGQLNSKDVSENWIFSNDSKDPHGISWNDHVKLGFEGWLIYLEEKVASIVTNEKLQTKPIHFSLGAIKTVEEFQIFAEERKSNHVTKEVQLNTSLSNPIIASKNDMNLVLKRSQNRYFKGTLTIIEGTSKLSKVAVNQEDNQDLSFNYHTSELGFVPLKYELESESQKIEGSLLLLNQNETKIKSNKIEDDKQVIYEIVNGDLTYRAAASFFPTMFSLTYKGKEWLDTTYPNPEPKAWWNPWAGGIRSYVSGISLFSFLKETSITHFVKRQDQYNNDWEGIAIETNITSHEKWKGLKTVQYFLTIPGVPIIVHFTELEHPNRTIHQYFRTELWLKHNQLKDTYLQIQEESGSKFFRAGSEEHIIQASNPYSITNGDGSQCLQIFSSYDALDSECIFSEEIALTSMLNYLTIDPGIRHSTEPIFLMFPEQPFDKETVESLKSIKF